MTRTQRRDPAQLDLDFAPRPQDADELFNVLCGLGLRSIRRCRLTRNRNVMVSFGAGELRVHEGYLNAPTRVLEAIVTFVEGRTRVDRRGAQQVIVSFPVRTPRMPARRERTHGDDEHIAQELTVWHRRYNMRHFSGKLRPIEIRVSRRMQSRLGHYT
ncbi:MAG TPA: hypothetical protein VFV33_21045, partial [Gemmatimonadaceae bacterium]|nr:hypothetical protein [Gemmatimonadaceae bacterium]